jgi:hypothetical protein
MNTRKPFGIEDIWTWFLRIMMGLVSFFLYEIYNDIKYLSKETNDIKVMMAESKKDIQYISQDYREFKDNAQRRITYLEQNFINEKRN